MNLEISMETSLKEIWAKALEVLQSNTNPTIFELWFRRIVPNRLEKETTIVFDVADDFTSLWIKENYESVIRQALQAVTGREYKIVYHSNGDSQLEKIEEPATKPKNHSHKTKNNDEFPINNGLSSQYTFETFVVGENNRMAHSTAIAVAHSPGNCYNPFFIYGGSGLGKTHLLQAIGNYVIKHKEKAKVIYLSSESFTNEFIEALQTNSLAAFRKKYRHVDVLLIDDVQFLANKERIQEEFFHTFNALYEGRKQIVMSCDRPATEIQNLQERLVTRFAWGLVADLQPPDVETRLAILKIKAKAFNANVSDDVLNFMAMRIRSDVRRLEGALLRVKSYQDLSNKQITAKEAENLLQDLLSEEAKRNITIEIIQKTVAEFYDIRLADMTSRRRPECIAFPRQVAMYLSRELTGHSLCEIGSAFGGRDHGTVLHAWKLVKDRMDVDQRVREEIRQIERKLRQ
ncbi:MAG: chromosomal replication initiator protein DnaA [Verrucomicrobiia bacterium]